MASPLRVPLSRPLNLLQHTSPPRLMFRTPTIASRRLATRPFPPSERASYLRDPRGACNGLCRRHHQHSSCFKSGRSATGLPTVATRRFFVSHGVLLDKKPETNSPLPPPAPKTPTIRAKILTTLKSSGGSRTSHEKIWNLPNSLTFSRLVAAPAVGYFILSSQPLVACGLFLYAGLTDLVDGYLARRYQAQTVVGTVIDPMADKALMTISAVSLAVQGSLPVALVALILARDAGLALSAIYIRWISLPPPKTMRRYWDFSLPSAEVRPTEISKLNTLLQLLLVGTAMLMPVLPAALVDAWHLIAIFGAFQYVVAATTVWSGASYVFSKDAFTILTREEIERRVAENEKKKGEGKEPSQGGPAAGVDPNEDKTR